MGLGGLVVVNREVVDPAIDICDAGVAATVTVEVVGATSGGDPAGEDTALPLSTEEVDGDRDEVVAAAAVDVGGGRNIAVVENRCSEETTPDTPLPPESVDEPKAETVCADSLEGAADEAEISRHSQPGMFIQVV